MSKVAYCFKCCICQQVLVVDKDKSECHVYKDVSMYKDLYTAFSNDDWNESIEGGREWYREAKRKFGEPKVVELDSWVDIHKFI